MDKIRYGISNSKYAVWDEETSTYGTIKDFPGAVSLSLTREGGDSSDFWADNSVFYSFAGTNGGYSADLEMARISDQVRVDLLGEVVDEATGVQLEVTDAKPAQFALITEMELDGSKVAFVFYNCKASRIEMNANTANDNPDVDTDTLNLRIAQQEFDYDGVTHGFVQGHIVKTSSNADKYAAFFQGVVIPTAGESGLSA